MGDCIDVMKTLPANSIDSLVTDPPYGWRFMGKAWDGADIVDKANKDLGRVGEMKMFSDGKLRKRRLRPAQAAGKYELTNEANFAFQKWTEEWAREAFRILKPGAHALIFCGPRTYHRMATGVEDAGFEIRDQLQWIFGSGFPKSLDISKGIDKCFGKSGKKVGSKGTSPDIRGNSYDGQVTSTRPRLDNPIIEPESAAAAAWQGWGTALKPANEPIVLARKPLEKNTVSKNVLKWGTGGLNIDGSRIASIDSHKLAKNWERKAPAGFRDGNHTLYGAGEISEGFEAYNKASQGRFPSNVLFDEDAARMLDEQSKGYGRSAGNYPSNSRGTGMGTTYLPKKPQGTLYGDSGGASRFFYVAKTSKNERNAGLDGSVSTHPTVKPFKLMRYLINLITPTGGIVLEPFLGSGTTGAVAVACGYKFIGIEREKEYFEIARARIKDVKLKSS